MHVLFAQQFDRQQLDSLGSLATGVRFIAKSEEGMAFLRGLLAHKRAMLYFSQPSTRTFLSFYAACEILGLGIGEVRDTATSSEFKGESREDSVRTFSSYFDLIIMRSEIGGLSERVAWVLSNTDRPVPIINAGSGKDQHPTQALLDIYTLQRSFEERGGIDGKTIVFVGDLARGRTVRSLSSLLTRYNNVKQYFVAPAQLQIGEDVLAMLKAAGVQYEVSDSFEKVIPEADAVYMTRVQDEWDTQKGESGKIDTSKYCFTVQHLDLLKPDAVIMHPFPRRNEISPDVDRDSRAVYWRQMRNGMWIRAALIAAIFDRDDQIRNYYSKNI
ncbi:MAG: aspartate carbamoyltransferase [Lentisphaerae bacterium RIFOXYA12_FULL_48_11]|nr:MAG: aspartate carbamoyltransferase [Lentisphaerae bacterium RIFOXYA12_FULL_48_11]